MCYYLLRHKERDSEIATAAPRQGRGSIWKSLLHKMTYRKILDKIRLAFPQPVSDSIHDSYFVHSIMRALDQVDALKTHLPMLGSLAPADFEKAREETLPDAMRSVEEVTADLVSYLQGMTIFGHPRTQQNVIPPPTIPSLIGVLLASLHNPNIVWDEYSRLVSLAEVEVVAMTAKLIGYNPQQVSGLFTFGGTATTLYGVKLGLEKACAGTMRKGMPQDAVVFVSDAGHYCASNIVGWLGIGTDNLITIPTTVENEIDLAQLEEQARAALKNGKANRRHHRHFGHHGFLRVGRFGERRDATRYACR